MKPEKTHPTSGTSFLRTLLVRLVMLLVLAGSVGLVWWSVNRLVLMNRQLKEVSMTMSALGFEVQQLEQGLNPIAVARSEDRYKEAQKSISGGPEESDSWLNILQEEALALSLLGTVELGKIQPLPRANLKLSFIPATIELRPLMESPQTSIPYQRMLNFTGILKKPNRRIDLLDFHVLGNSNSVHHATAVVQLWSPEGKP